MLGEPTPHAPSRRSQSKTTEPVTIPLPKGRAFAVVTK